MANKKLKPISNTRKAYIQQNFNRVNPDKLGKAAKQYYNKVKAGKASYAKKFIDRKTGKFEAFPQKFIDEFIKPVAGMDGFSSYKDWLKYESNREEAKKVFQSEKIEWLYNENGLNKFLDNFKGETININGEDFSVLEARIFLKEFDQVMKSQNVVYYEFKITLTESFTRAFIKIPDLGNLEGLTPDELIELLQEAGITAIISDPKAKKGKK
jgi:translation initiation factor 2 beta subunit (eIF-2beta)/eIF-5